jgi:DNA-directed RNA polymerase specialized sigma24 family protein
VKTWDELPVKDATKLFARSLRNAAKDYCQKEKAKTVGYSVEDLYYYDRELLERLLPSVIAGDRTAPSLNDLGFTNNKKVASEGNNWFAMVADIEQAMSKLNKEQQGMMTLRFGEGCTIESMATAMSITPDAARMRINRAMTNLLNYLGGKRPKYERDYTEGEMNGTQSDDGRRDENDSSVEEEVRGLDVDEGTD